MTATRHTTKAMTAQEARDLAAQYAEKGMLDPLEGLEN